MEFKKVTKMGCIFQECSLLSSLPDISIWNTENVTTMNGLFSTCLISLPDISKWNTKKLQKWVVFFKNVHYYPHYLIYQFGILKM